MKHSLDHSTATEANGIIWELCSRCECWVGQHDRTACDPLEPHVGRTLLLDLALIAVGFCLGFLCR